jgi:hypothetical protein
VVLWKWRSVFGILSTGNGLMVDHRWLQSSIVLE